MKNLRKNKRKKFEEKNLKMRVDLKIKIWELLNKFFLIQTLEYIRKMIVSKLKKLLC